MKAKRLTTSDIDNVITEQFLFKRFKLLAMNMFEYEGLDDLNIEERHIEEFLFEEGKAFAFEDPELGFMILPCNGLGTNVYGDPLNYHVTGFGYSKIIPADKGVLIENNKLRMSTAEIITYFTNQLYEVVRTRDTNIKTLKLPFILTCDDKNVFTVKKILEQINENVYALITDKNVINLEEIIKVLPTGAKPYTAELTDQYHDILNEALTYLGINNANTDKRERLIGDEVNANNQFIECCAEMFLEARQRAFDKINDMFGTDIKVKLRNEGGADEIQLLSQPIAGEQQSGNI